MADRGVNLLDRYEISDGNCGLICIESTKRRAFHVALLLQEKPHKDCTVVGHDRMARRGAPWKWGPHDRYTWGMILEDRPMGEEQL